MHGDPNSLLLSARTAMWSVPVVLTEWKNKNDSQNQCKSCESMQRYIILQSDIIVMTS